MICVEPANSLAVALDTNAVSPLPAPMLRLFLPSAVRKTPKRKTNDADDWQA